MLTQEEYEKRLAKAKEYAENARKRRLEKISSPEYRQKQLKRLNEAKKRQYDRVKAKGYNRPIKTKQKTYKKLGKPYFSVLTDDINKCMFTGTTDNVVRHHIFGAANKTFSEKYGFIAPCRIDWHEGYSYSIHTDKELDLSLKHRCEEYWLNTLGKTKEEWLKECSGWW